MKSKKITLLNIISNIILQFTNILTWFVIPKVILSYFGSDVNGLVSSITQFLSYISLVEGGISGVVMASLYKPIVENDIDKISSIVKTSDNFYKKIGSIFIIYCLILGLIYPFIIKTGFSFLYVFSLVLVLSVNVFIQYMFSLTLKNLLNADKRGYIVSFVQSIILIISIVLTYVSVIIYPSIHFLKFLTGIIFIIQPIVFTMYVNKNYKLVKNSKVDNDLLKQRWNGFAINIAAFIHNCTDIAILTIFTNLATVSIYSVYTLVTNGLKSIFNAISNAIVPTIGHAYASGNSEDLNNKMDLYEYITFLIVFFMFSVAGLLITPFVLIYTNGINDADYNQFLFGILIIISEALYLVKFPHLNLSYSANKFKELTVPAYIEAGINILVSVILVYKFGLIGVAIGTIVAMTYRLFFQIYFSTKMINDRKQWGFYKKMLIFVISTIIGIIICSLLPNVKYNIGNWCLFGAIYSLIFGFIYLITSLLFFKKEVKFLKKYIFKR